MKGNIQSNGFQTPYSPEWQSPINILYIEDEEDDVIILRRNLKSTMFLPFQLFHALTLDRARLLINEYHIDVILVDQRLKRDDGFNVLNNLTSDYSIPVIMLSGMYNDDSIRQALQASAATCISKTDVVQHPEIIARAIESARSRYADWRKINTFIVHVLHDLAAPIRGAKSELISETGEPEELTLASTRKVLRCVDDIFTLYQRLEQIYLATTLKYRIQSVNMRDLFAQIVDDQKDILSKKGVSVEIQPDLPDIEGYPDLLGIAFRHLFSNAIRYLGSPEKPWIKIGCHSDIDSHIFYISDNGLGVDPRYHERMFFPLERIHRDGDNYQPGLGLSIARMIAGRHRGHCWIESEPMKGATLYFSVANYDDNHSLSP